MEVGAPFRNAPAGSAAFNSERSEVLHQAELRRLNLELEQRVNEQTKQLVERAKELEDANHQLEQKNSMLKKMALTDPLTGVPNRRMIDRLAKRNWLADLVIRDPWPWQSSMPTTSKRSTRDTSMTEAISYFGGWRKRCPRRFDTMWTLWAKSAAMNS